MTTDEIQVTNAEIFARYVEENHNYRLWEELISKSISHEKFGPGKIQYLSGNSKNPKMIIEFENYGCKKFYADCFARRFSMDELPIDIPNIEKIRSTIYQEKKEERLAELRRIEEERRREEERRKAEEERKRQEEKERIQREKELKGRREFEQLKNKYGIVAEDETEPTSPLFLILKKHDAGEDLKNDEIDWLIKQHYYEFTINYLIKHYIHAGNPWDLIKAAKLYRITDRPKKALTLTKDLLPFDNRAKSALCTNRGAAYKDLGEYEKALVLGKKALEYQQDSLYAYNL